MVGGMGRAALYLKVSPTGLWPAARSRPVAGFSRLTPDAANPRNSITHVGETLALLRLSAGLAPRSRMLGMRGLPFWSSNVGKKGSFCIPRFTSIILQVPGVMLCLLGMQELPFWSSNVGKKGSFCIPRFTGIILQVSGVMPGMLGMRKLLFGLGRRRAGLSLSDNKGRMFLQRLASCGDDEADDDAG